MSESEEMAARQFINACWKERLRLSEKLRELERLEIMARQSSADHLTVWAILESVPVRRLRLAAAIALLAEGAIADRRKYLEADTEGREQIISEILVSGKFTGVNQNGRKQRSGGHH